MTTLNTLIADLAAEVESLRRSNARLVNAARRAEGFIAGFEAASYADCVEIAKNAISARILPYPPVKYGCHCDLEEGAHPDGCLIDENKHDDGGIQYWQELGQYEEFINGNSAPIKPVETQGEASWDSSHQTMADQASSAFLPAHSSVAASH